MFDKKIIQKNFSRVAGRYDEAAVVQREAVKELCELVVRHKASGVRRGLILDLGSGTSFIAKKLLTYDKWRSEASNLQFAQQRNKKNSKYLRLTPYDSKIFELDLSAEMLQSWHDRPSNVFPIQGDIENPPFRNHSFDLIISSFSLQWIEDFEKNFSKIFSLLKPSGTFAFCLPTDGSLTELKSANIFNFNELPKIKNLKSALKKSGFTEIFFAKKIVKQNFQNGLEALKSLKKIGANYSDQQKKIITRTQLNHFNKFCLKNFGTTNKNIEISWSVSYFLLQKS